MTDILNARVAALTIAARLRRAADELESQEITIKRQQQLTLYLAYDLSELARDSGADIDAEERERAESKRIYEEHLRSALLLGIVKGGEPS